MVLSSGEADIPPPGTNRFTIIDLLSLPPTFNVLKLRVELTKRYIIANGYRYHPHHDLKRKITAPTNNHVRWKLISGHCLIAVPPDIINEESSTDIAVQEQEDTVLTCRATGNPTPRVTWRREDGENIILRRPGNREVIKGELVVTVFGPLSEISKSFWPLT